MTRYQDMSVLIMAVVAAALLLTATTTATAKASNCRFKAIFNFGDSNSDTGGLSSFFGETPPPYGETFFHHTAGRASDGRLIIDFIAERLDFPYLSAYLDSIGSNFTHGVNFATGGSTILSANTTLSQGGASPVSLTVQVRQFKQFKRRSQVVRNQGGVCEPLKLPDEKAFSRALYTFDIGQNDLTDAYKMNLSTLEVKLSVPDLLRKLSEEIKDVYGEGARTFWIHNTGPLGCLPSTLVLFPVSSSELDSHGCSKPHNDAAKFFNLKLKEMVDQLRFLLPLASVTYVDIYSAKYLLISNAKKIGFDNPLLVCCGHGEKYNYSPLWRCGQKKSLNGTLVIANPCAKPES